LLLAAGTITPPGLARPWELLPAPGSRKRTAVWRAKTPTELDALHPRACHQNRGGIATFLLYVHVGGTCVFVGKTTASSSSSSLPYPQQQTKKRKNGDTKNPTNLNEPCLGKIKPLDAFNRWCNLNNAGDATSTKCRAYSEDQPLAFCRTSPPTTRKGRHLSAAPHFRHPLPPLLSMSGQYTPSLFLYPSTRVSRLSKICPHTTSSLATSAGKTQSRISRLALCGLKRGQKRDAIPPEDLRMQGDKKGHKIPLLLRQSPHQPKSCPRTASTNRNAPEKQNERKNSKIYHVFEETGRRNAPPVRPEDAATHSNGRHGCYTRKRAQRRYLPPDLRVALLSAGRRLLRPPPAAAAAAGTKWASASLPTPPPGSPQEEAPSPPSRQTCTLHRPPQERSQRPLPPRPPAPSPPSREQEKR